jgi:hypothetical protein
VSIWLDGRLLKRKVLFDAVFLQPKSTFEQFYSKFYGEFLRQQIIDFPAEVFEIN